MGGGRDKALRKLEGHTGAVTAVAYSSEGEYVVTVVADTTVRLWDAATGHALSFPNSSLGRRGRGHAGTVTSVAFSNDDQRITSGDAPGIIKIWNAASGKVLRTLTGHKKAVLAIACGTGGSRLISLDAAVTLRYWNVGFPAPYAGAEKKSSMGAK